MGSCGSCVPAWPGGTCPSGTCRGSRCTRFRRWAKNGTFTRMLRAAEAQVDAAGDIDRLVSVDSTVVRAHHHAAGARKGGARHSDVREAADQQDSSGLRCLRPPARAGGHGRKHQRLHPVHHGDGSDPGAPYRPGRPRTRPSHVIGDKGYSSKAIRTWLRRQGIAHTIPERADQVRNRLRCGSHGSAGVDAAAIDGWHAVAHSDRCSLTGRAGAVQAVGPRL